MSQQLARKALADGEVHLVNGDHEAAIERFEAAAQYYLAEDRLLLAIRTYRKIFGLDMLRSDAPRQLLELHTKLDRVGGCKEAWEEHLEQLDEVKRRWPFRTATIRLATLTFDEDGREAFLGYLEGSDPIAVLTRISTDVMRCRVEHEFDYVTDMMIGNIVARGVMGWTDTGVTPPFELEVMRSDRVFMISAEGDIATSRRVAVEPAASENEDRLLSMLYEADLLATFGMSETARDKYRAVLEFDPHNPRAKSALVRIDEATRETLAEPPDLSQIQQVLESRQKRSALHKAAARKKRPTAANLKDGTGINKAVSVSTPADANEREAASAPAKSETKGKKTASKPKKLAKKSAGDATKQQKTQKKK